jgi:SAM-dependent methyltransferase
MRTSARLFHAITVKDYEFTPGAGRRSAEYYEESTRRFVKRFGGHLDVRGKDVLDVGCGTGDMAAVLARDGAAHVVGVDVNLAPEEPDRIRERYGDEVAGRVELIRTTGDLSSVGDRTFDLVVSKEALEHYADPETFIPLMAERVKPGGSLVIGFGPLWKAFDGGHIDFMTKVPWAHLVFPEDVIMAERRRFRPQEHATHFGEILGGLNKMTLERFETIMAGTGLEQTYVKHNAGDHPAVRAMHRIARVRPLREYFTNNVYGIWTRPSPDADRPPAGRAQSPPAGG